MFIGDDRKAGGYWADCYYGEQGFVVANVIPNTLITPEELVEQIKVHKVVSMVDFFRITKQFSDRLKHPFDRWTKNNR